MISEAEAREIVDALVAIPAAERPEQIAELRAMAAAPGLDAVARNRAAAAAVTLEAIHAGEPPDTGAILAVERAVETSRLATMMMRGPVEVHRA